MLNCALSYISSIPFYIPFNTSSLIVAGGTGYIRLEPATETLLVLTIYRPGLHQGIMGYIVGMSNATVQWILCGWVIFLATLFYEINLKLPSKYKLKEMPKIFVEAGHGSTVLVINATEFKCLTSS